MDTKFRNPFTIIVTLLVVMLVFAGFPFIGKVLILPAPNDIQSRYFAGEWFNKYDFTAEEYQIVDRWAHYLGYHGCEPEPDNCPYRGVTGQWKLLLSYLIEGESFPAELFEKELINDTSPLREGVPPKAEPKIIEGLIPISAIDETIQIDLRYATENNFTGQVIYPIEIAVLQKGTADKLAKANQKVAQYGYRIKIWDAYRPLECQKILWDAAPDKYYVAKPETGSKHNRGAAVDVTLVTTNGQEVEMPTGFDDFSEKAHRSYKGMSKEAARNLGILTDAMAKSGFSIIHREWWHYEDTEWQKYPLLDVQLEEFAD